MKRQQALVEVREYQTADGRSPFGRWLAPLHDSKEPLIESHADRVCAQAASQQGARRSAVAGPTVKPGNAVVARLGPNHRRERRSGAPPRSGGVRPSAWRTARACCGDVRPPAVASSGYATGTCSSPPFSSPSTYMHAYTHKHIQHIQIIFEYLFHQ